MNRIALQRLAILALVAAAAPISQSVSLAGAASAALSGSSGADVNGDGFDDLVIGVPGEDNLNGALTVALGATKGPDPRTSSMWSYQTPGIEQVAGFYGASHASGDFDADGYDDLAIGAPIDSDQHSLDSGAVGVLYGSPVGPTVERSQRWSQATPGIHGDPGGLEHFGAKVATGDFNADGYDDLVVALGRDKRGFVPAIHLIYGSAVGLTATGSDYWDWPDRGNRGRFPDDGVALAVADFDADGDDDLAWGIPTHKSSRGGVHLFDGSVGGLVIQPGDPLSQATPGVDGNARADELFGTALAAADFDGDGSPDLAVGVAAEQSHHGSTVRRAVQVFAGSPVGLTTESTSLDEHDLQVSHQPDSPYPYLSLTAGDLNADGLAELAIGFPEANVVGADGTQFTDAGAVAVVPGSLLGLVAADAVRWDQESRGMKEDAGYGDRFGSATTVSDYNGDGYGDLAIGVPGEEVLDQDGAGSVNILFGSAAGLTATDNELWSQATRFVEDLPESYESFGTL